MQLGQPVPGSAWIQNWRFVESDLHDISRRVQEYDSEARLVCDVTDGQIGIARKVPSYLHLAGGYWTIAIQFEDPDTGEPVRKADGRVLQTMGRMDSYRVNLANHQERMRQRQFILEKQQENALSETNGDHAERFVHELRRDVSARPRAFIPEKVPA